MRRPPAATVEVTTVVWHGCRHSPVDPHPLLGDYPKKPTILGMDYAGRYRCMTCKRLVKFDVSPATWRHEWERLPRIEPPYPDGYC